jgi:hypothetical protein
MGAQRATEPTCPLCGAAPRTPVGAPYVGTIGMLWWKRAFDERLHRCMEGHVFSFRVERGRGGERTATESHESVEDWLRARTGSEVPRRPPGL